MDKPVWGTMPAQPTLSPSNVTAGSKGKIIMSPNVVTLPGKPASSGGAPQSMEK